jgi:hypothetical protein
MDVYLSSKLCAWAAIGNVELGTFAVCNALASAAPVQLAASLVHTAQIAFNITSAVSPSASV